MNEEKTPGLYEVHEACIYVLNSKGQNRIYAQIQPGQHDDQRTSDDECEATAAFMGTACNCHDALLEACKAPMRANEQLMPGIGYIACQDYEIINEAPILGRTALALAGVRV